jgi:hypothetical protein
MMLLDSTGHVYWAPAVAGQSGVVAFSATGAAGASTAMNVTPGFPPVQQTSAGALVAFINNGAATPFLEIAVYHPNISGNNGVRLYTPTAVNGTPAASASALNVFPGGEMIWQYRTATANDHFLGGIFYDGSAANQPPSTVTPAPFGTAATATLATNLQVVRPGLVIGELPSTATGAPLQFFEIDLKAATPSVLIPGAPFAAGVGTIQPGAVQDRFGRQADFSVSDDLTKAIWVTQDTATGQPTTYTLRIADLATGTQSILDSSPNLVSTSFPPHFVHSAASYSAPTLPVAGVPAVVWAEKTNSVISFVNHERLFYAIYSATSSPPTPVAVDRETLAGANRGSWITGAGAAAIDSAAGAVLLFMVDSDFGGYSLYSVPLTASTGGTASAALVADAITGFAVREDEAQLLVGRSAGSLLLGRLVPGTSPSQQLQPILEGGPQGIPSLPLNPSFGFTPDGAHVFAAVDQWSQSTPGAGTVLPALRGILDVVDISKCLATPAPANCAAARTNYGRTAWSETFGAGLFNGSGTAVMVETYSVNSVNGHLVWASSNTGTRHTEIPQAAKNFQVGGAGASNSNFAFATSMDGNEAAFNAYGSALGLQSNGSQYLISTGTAGIPFSFPGFIPFFGTPVTPPIAPQPATYLPYGGPTLPAYGFLSNGTGAVAGLGATFKVFGGSSPAPFISVSRPGGTIPIVPSIFGSPALVRKTVDNKELLYEFYAFDGFYYAIDLTLPGTAPPPAPVP